MMDTPPLLILDLDETLIHATHAALEGHRVAFETDYYDVYKRPFVDEFIAFCLQHFRVAVWTSSGELYAQQIVTALFADPAQLHFIWSRRRCTTRLQAEWHEYVHVKNLKKVKQRGYPLERVLIIDDSPEKLIHQYGNLIRVKPFEGQRDDQELRLLMPYLLHLKDQPNLRKIEKRNWRQVSAQLCNTQPDAFP